MLPFPTLRVALACAAGLAAALGCPAPGPDADSPEGAAAATVRALFDLARSERPDARGSSELFDPPPTGAAAAALEDVLDELARVAEPRVVLVEPLDGPERLAVDLVGSPASGGTASYSIHVVRRDGGFRIEWISGPALVWPSRSGPRGPGLSSSPTDGPP